MYFKALKIMTIWVAVALAACTLLAPTTSAVDRQRGNSTAPAAAVASSKNSTATQRGDLAAPAKKVHRRDMQTDESAHMPIVRVKLAPLGDVVGLKTALDSRMDLMPAAGEHKKYILVKKKPKHKKIKMDVYEPKMKYKKIKMKIPIKKLKKKKVKGYLVKKEHEHY